MKLLYFTWLCSFSPAALVCWYYITKYYKFVSLKHLFMISQLLWVCSLAWPWRFLCFSQGYNHCVARAAILSEAQGPLSSSVIFVRIHFLEAVVFMAACFFKASWWKHLWLPVCLFFFNRLIWISQTHSG